MRVMFIESNPVMIPLLPKGFSDAGFEVTVTSISSKEHLMTLLKLFRPQLVFTHGWGNEQIHERQHWIRESVKEMKIPHVYWSIEDPIYTDYFVVPLLKVAQPDFVFTISPEHVKFYRSMGYPSAYLDWGVHPDLNHPTKPDPKYMVDIALIANSYYDTIEQFNDYRLQAMKIILKPLVKAGIRVDIWGKGWEHMQPHLGVKIPDDWLRGELPYTECNTVYSSAKIILGFQNVITQVTQRTYEVLAAGGVLLSVDTPAARNLFKPQKDILLSDSPEKTKRIVKKYLRDEIARKQISSRGRAAALRHSYVSRVGYIMDTLTKAGILSK